MTNLGGKGGGKDGGKGGGRGMQNILQNLALLQGGWGLNARQIPCAIISWHSKYEER